MDTWNWSRASVWSPRPRSTRCLSLCIISKMLVMSSVLRVKANQVWNLCLKFRAAFRNYTAFSSSPKNGRSQTWPSQNLSNYISLFADFANILKFHNSSFNTLVLPPPLIPLCCSAIGRWQHDHAQTCGCKTMQLYGYARKILKINKINTSGSNKCRSRSIMSGLFWQYFRNLTRLLEELSV